MTVVIAMDQVAEEKMVSIFSCPTPADRILRRVIHHHPINEISLMNILSTAFLAANSDTQELNNERLPEVFSNGRKVKNPPPNESDNMFSRLPDMLASYLPISKKSITKTLTDSIPEITTSRITIMDSGQKLDMEKAWGEIEYYLDDLIGLSPEHLQEAQHNLQQLTVNKFQHLEDLVDHLVANLNEREGTRYPLTDEIDNNSQATRGAGVSTTLYSLTKFAVAALASQSVLSHVTPMASASPLSGLSSMDRTPSPSPAKFQNNYEFFADYTPQISVPDNDSPYTLKDNKCGEASFGMAFDTTGIEKPKPLKDNATITGGYTACLPQMKHSSLTLAIPNSNKQNSISVSTGYGTGNLKLSLNNGAATDPGNPVPGRNSSNICAILKNPDQYWSFLTIKGSADQVTLAVDFNTDKCRTPFNFGVGSDRPKPVLTDTCASEKPVETEYGRLLKVRKAVCLPSNKDNKLTAVITPRIRNVAITTGQGSGDLTLSVENLFAGRRGSKRQGINNQAQHKNRPGNHDCIILDPPRSTVAHITTSGKAQNASLVVDYNSDTCRLPVRPGFTRETNDRSQGFPYKSSHLLIYKLAYADADVNWPSLTDDLEKTNEFYKKQAYDDFYVSWDVIETRIDTSIDIYKDGKAYKQWQDRVFDAIRCTGVDPGNPGRNKMIMVVTPKSEGLYSYATSNLVVLDDSWRSDSGVIAHQIGHAMGLRGSGAIDGGPQVIRDMPDDDSWYKCGNRRDCYDARKQYLKDSGNFYDLMGPDGHYDLGHEMSLFDKSFFGWIDPDTDAPLTRASGTYRIHAFDQGKKPDAPMGLRIQSGNQNYTYWLEYRTTGKFARNTRQGIVVSLEGYAQKDSNPRYWDKKSYLLDMTPDSAKDSSAWWGPDFEDATLLVGQSYTDKWGGFTMTPKLVGGRENSPDAWIEVDVQMKDDGLAVPGDRVRVSTTSATPPTSAPGTSSTILHDVAVVYLKKEGEAPRFDIDELHGRISNQADSLIRSNSYQKEGFGKVGKFGWYDVAGEQWNARLSAASWTPLESVVLAKRNGSLNLTEYDYVMTVWDDRQSVVPANADALTDKENIVIDGTNYGEKSQINKYLKSYDLHNQCFYKKQIYDRPELCYTNPGGTNLMHFEVIIFHEFLHTKKLAHHNVAKYCENVLLGHCSIEQYNMFDALSSARFYGNSLNACDKHLINWLTDEDIVYLESTSGSHEITLHHLNSEDGGKKAVKIDFQAFLGADIWLEFRQPTMLDYGLFNPVFDKATSGLMIYQNNKLLDATPQTPAIDYEDLTDVAITDHFYFDPLGMTIDIIDVDRQLGTIRFRIDLSTTKPVRNNPLIHESSCDDPDACRVTRGGSVQKMYRAEIADIGYGNQKDKPWTYSLTGLPSGITWVDDGINRQSSLNPNLYWETPHTLITFSADASVKPGSYQFTMRFMHPDNQSNYVDIEQWLTVEK